MSKPIRLATVTATGARYVVQQIDFQTDTVHCWGEVTGYRHGRTTHQGSKQFARGEVTIAQVRLDEVVVTQLLRQAHANGARRPVPINDQLRAALGSFGPEDAALVSTINKALRS